MGEMTTNHAMLQLEGLTKRYPDGTEALTGIDLQVAVGEVMTLVGPSGCGKSTLLRLIAGLDIPSSGRVICGGRDITRLPAEQRGMGVVFQHYALFPQMTVAENVGFGLRVRGIARASRDHTVTGILETLGLATLADRLPAQLSGGQQQRVALGRALAIQPSVLLLDEPLTALDAHLRETLRIELRQTLERFQITAIYVTHDQVEALSLGDRVAILRAGRIEQVATPTTVYQAPTTRFVAQFIGTMNTFTGTLRITPEGTIVETPHGPLPVQATNFASGSQVSVLIRPEDLLIDANGALAGHVTQVQFLGDRLRLVVRLPGATDLVADCSPYAMVTTGTPLRFAIRHATVLLSTSGGMS